MSTAIKTKTEPVAFLGSEGVYMLPHHAKEIERLTKQHHLLATTTEGLLLAPSVTAGNVPLKVLDAGCADGTWLRSLREQFPGRDLDLVGVDIGSTLFPPAETQKASGISLHSYNITTPFPPSWTNTFDIVHQRLLVWGLRTADWPTVIKNYIDTLKPGGYLHLVEIEFISKTDPHPDSRPQLQKQAALQKWSTATFGMDIDIAYRLPDLMKDAGLEGVETLQFDHGYGALARDPDQKEVSAQLWVECFRTVDTKIPCKSQIFFFWYFLICMRCMWILWVPD